MVMNKINNKKKKIFAFSNGLQEENPDQIKTIAAQVFIDTIRHAESTTTLEELEQAKVSA